MGTAFGTPFLFGSDRSATRGSYVTVSVANGSIMSFLAVFKQFRFRICNRLENTVTLLIQICYNVTSIASPRFYYRW
jgi:hypothetical protein